MSRKLATVSLLASLMGGTVLADAPKVAVDIAPVHSLVARVMDGVGTPGLILPPGASPHGYSLRPSEAGLLQEAALVFWVGADLSPWLEDAVDTLASDARNVALLDVDATTLLDTRTGALFEKHDHAHDGDDHAHDHDKEHDHAQEAKAKHDHDHDHDDHDHAEHAHDDHQHDAHGQEDHAHGDKAHDDHAHDTHAHAEDSHDHGHNHGAHDPHVWLAPSNAKAWLNVIAAELSAADPDNAGAYFANAAAAREELDGLVSEVDGLLAPVRGMSFVVFHDAYQYFEVDFDLPAAGAISLSDASDPSPARVAEIRDRVQAEGVDCVLAEPQFNPGIVAAVLEGTAAKTAVIDPIGAELETGPGLYPALIRNMAKSLADCL
jgi:zinc transport system substrate-binding protein